MMAHEIAERIITIIKELDGFYRAEETTRAAYAVAEETVKLRRAQVLLAEKAQNAKLTGPELEAAATVNTYQDRMEAIRLETAYQRARHDADRMEKELMAQQTILAVEKVKIERGIEIQ